MKEESLLIKALGNSPKIRIIDFFLDNKIFDFSKKEIIEGVGMSKTTFYKYFNELEELEMVKVSRTFGRTKLYELNKKNPIVKKLMEIDQKLMLEYVNKIKHGKIPVKF
ncbi:MAG: winged helix-turn-helix domain-containing protein [Methanosarcinales archaeon]